MDPPLLRRGGLAAPEPQAIHSRFDPDIVIDCVPQVLFTSEIVLGGVNRCIPKQKLNLFFSGFILVDALGVSRSSAIEQVARVLFPKLDFFVRCGEWLQANGFSSALRP